MCACAVQEGQRGWCPTLVTLPSPFLLFFFFCVPPISLAGGGASFAAEQQCCDERGCGLACHRLQVSLGTACGSTAG